MSYNPQPFSTNLSSVVPLSIKGTTNQSANLTEWRNVSGGVVASISPTGNLAASNFINNASTGIYHWAAPGLSAVTSTTFSVASAAGWIVDTSTNSVNPVITNVNYPGISSTTTPYLSTSTTTYLLLNTSGNLVYQPTLPTAAERRSMIYLGSVVHPLSGYVIQNIKLEPDIAIETFSQTRDMLKPIGYINGGIVVTSNGTNLTFRTTAGTLHGLGINYINDNRTPSGLTIAAKLSASFQYRNQLGATSGVTRTTINPTSYDLNGTITTITGGGLNNRSTNQRIFLSPSGLIRIQYGQVVYTSLTNAIAGVNTESFVTAQVLLDNFILIGILSVRYAATDLSLTTDARFIPVSKFGENLGGVAGITTATLQTSYDNSSTPEIVTNSTLGPVSFKSGNSSADKVVETANASNISTAWVTGDGDAVFNTISASNYKPLQNRYIVGPLGNFQTLSSAMTWLSANMSADTELLLDSGAYNIADTISINLPYRLLINGIYYEACKLQAATGLTNKPMFIATSDVCFNKLTFLGNTLASYGTLSTENCIDITGNNYHEVNTFDMNTFNTGIQVLGDTGSIYVFDSYIQNCSDSGIKMNSNGANKVDVEIVSFVNCNKGVSLQKGVSGLFHIMDNIFLNGVGGTCISYTPSAYSYSDSPAVISNVWNNIGSFYTGFDFSLSAGRDADIYMRSNAGKEDKAPHFKVNVVDNALTTIAVAPNTYYKANFTQGSTYACKYLIESNKYTYLTKNATDMVVWINGNIQVNGNTRTLNIAIRKNGATTGSLSAISPITVRTATTSQPISFGIVAYLEDFVKGDYIELFVSGNNGGDAIIVQDLTIFGQAQ